MVADFTGAQPSGRYSFASSTPKTLGDLLKGNPQQDSVNIIGHLFLPSGTEKVPAVLLMHGSGGIYSALLGYWPERFNAASFAVLSVDSFGPRGVKSTAEDQSLVPYAADLADAFAGFKPSRQSPSCARCLRVEGRLLPVATLTRTVLVVTSSGVERLRRSLGNLRHQSQS